MPGMGERDAFGRERAENPLAAMGWGAAEDRTSRAAPIAAVGAADTAAPVATVAAAPPPRAAAPRRIETRRKHVAYLLLGVHGWDVFSAGGRQYRADLSGRHVHRGG